MTNSTKLLVGISGSLAVLGLPSYLAVLFNSFPHLKIILTHSANQLIPKETFEMFSSGIYTNEFPLSKENMNHVELARWADLFIVLPATAHVLAEAARGSAGSLLCATILAHKQGAIFFPNMNAAMWEKKATQRNVALLKEDGHKIIPPVGKPAFEYASRKLEINHVLPSIESVLSILQLEIEMNLCQTTPSL